MTPMENILVIAEEPEGKLSPFVQDLVAAARQIGKFKIWVLVPGQSPVEPARQSAAATGCDTIALDFPRQLTPETLKQGLAYTLTCWTKGPLPKFILFPHNTMGREVAPGLGAGLGAAVFSGVTDIQNQGSDVVFYRQVLDNTRILCLRPVQGSISVLTLAPGAFGGKIDGTCSKGGKVMHMDVPLNCLAPSVRRLNVTARAGGNDEIIGAKIVVGAGRGIGDRDNLGKIEAFAEILPGACMGASRPLVDQGWVPYNRQVGITGTTVAPDLYIACGISGSSQHLAGMAGSKWVVSINKNPDAPICRHSDLCIQADTNEFIDVYLESK